MLKNPPSVFFFFFNDTAPPEIYPLPLHAPFPILRGEPTWPPGAVPGPQVRLNLADFRKAVPPRYPVRDYPDITHSRHCQYPVPDWDVAFAQIGRAHV